MYGLTKIKGLIDRGGPKLMLTVFAIAAFISFSAAPAQAQCDDIFLTGNTVELANRATIRVHYDTGFGNRIAIKGTARVFSGSTGALLQSHELTSPTAGVFSVDINRDDLREEGEPDTGQLQIWIVVAINACSTSEPGADGSEVWVLRSTFELIDNESGRTTARWTTTNFLTTVGQVR